MEKPILLSADMSCDIGPELQERYHVSLYPLHVLLEGKQYTDGVDICPEDLYRAWYERKALPKTAASNPAEYAAYFRPFVEQGYEVLHISLGSGLSSSFQNARLAGESLGGSVHVVDSRNLSTGFGHMVCEAGERIRAGMDAAQIAAELEALAPRISASFVLDTLEFLHASGRCSSLAHIGANLLGLKPCIEVHEGKMSVAKKYRGTLAKAIESYVTDRIKDHDDFDKKRVFITDSGVDTEIVETVEKLLREYGGFEALLGWIRKAFRGKRGGQIGMGLLVGAMDIATANNTVAIVMANPIAKEMSEEYGITPRKAASILDTFSCIFQGIIPYGAQMLVAISAAHELGYAISAFDIIPNLFYPYLLAVSSFFFIAIDGKKKA